MPYVITQACCNDASCAAVCPVDCIHPNTGGRPLAVAVIRPPSPRTRPSRTVQFCPLEPTCTRVGADGRA